MVAVGRLSVGQVKLLRFLASEGEQPTRIVHATYDALINRGLIFRDEADRLRCKATELGHTVVEILKAADEAEEAATSGVVASPADQGASDDQLQVTAGSAVGAVPLAIKP